MSLPGISSIIPVANPHPSEFLPYVYDNYPKFMSGLSASGGYEANLQIKTARSSGQPSGSHSRNQATVLRHWYPPGGITGVTATVRDATIILYTIRWGSSVNAPTSPLVNGGALTTTPWFDVSNSTHGSARFDIGYLNSDPNVINHISAIFQATTQNQFATQTIIILPGRWEPDGSPAKAAASGDNATAFLGAMEPYTLAMFTAQRNGDAIPPFTLGGTGVLELGRNSSRWYNGALMGVAYAPGSGATGVSASATSGGAVGIAKLKYTS